MCEPDPLLRQPQSPTVMNGPAAPQPSRKEGNPLRMRSSTSLPAAAFPDKKRENTPKRYSASTPNGRSNANPLFLRRISSTGYSSCEESPAAIRRVTSFGSNPDSSRPVKYLFGTPKTFEGTPVETAFLSRQVLSEMSRDVENDENRPPSPRPSDPVQVYVEHNKQLQVWDDWVLLTNSGTEADLASITYRRTKSLQAPEALPKALEPLSLSDLNRDD